MHLHGVRKPLLAVVVCLAGLVAVAVGPADASHEHVTIEVGGDPSWVENEISRQTVLVVSPLADEIVVLEGREARIAGRLAVEDPRDVAASYDRIFVTSGAGSLEVFDHATFEHVGSVAIGDSPTGVAISEGGDHVFVADTGTDRVYRIEAESLTVEASIGVAPDPMFLTFGDYLLVSSTSANKVTVLAGGFYEHDGLSARFGTLDNSEGLIGVVDVPAPGRGALYCGGYAWVAADHKIVNIVGSSIRETIDLPFMPIDPAFPCGGAVFAAITGTDGQLWLLDFESPDFFDPVEVGSAPTGAVYASHFDGTESLYVADPTDGTVTVFPWDTEGPHVVVVATPLSGREVTVSSRRLTDGDWNVALQCVNEPCDEVWFRLNGGESQVYEGPFLLNDEGAVDIEVSGRDEHGNVSRWRRASRIGIDRTLPQTSIDSTGDPPPTGAWTSGSWSVTLSCFDPEGGEPPIAGGCDRREARLDDTEWMPATSVVIDDEGFHGLEARSTDIVGNVSPSVFRSLGVDTTPPATEIHAEASIPPVDGWTRGEWVIELHCTDPMAGSPAGASGCETTEVETGDTWMPYTDPIRLDDDGIHSVSYRSTDRVAHTSPTGTQEFRVDHVGPSVELRILRPVFVRSFTQMVLTADAHDLLPSGEPASGVASLCFRIVEVLPVADRPHGCLPAQKFVPEWRWQSTFDLSTGVYDVWGHAVDRVGNESESSPVRIYVVS